METPAPEARRILQPMRKDQHQPCTCDRVHEEFEVLLSARVGPMHIFEDQQEWPNRRSALSKRAQGVECPSAPCHRVHRQNLRIAWLNCHEITDVRNL